MDAPTVSRSRWLWPAALAAMIVFASSQSHVPGPRLPHFDKLVHFAAFALLATLVARTATGLRRPWVAIVIASAFGASDELHQLFTPGRSADVADWIADTSGACLAVVLYGRWTAYRRMLEWPLIRRKRRLARRRRPQEETTA